MYMGLNGYLLSASITAHILSVSPEKQMIHCAVKEHHVQLIASKKNASVMQDMKAVTPAWEEIISRGSSGLQQWGASQESTSKTPA